MRRGGEGVLKDESKVKESPCYPQNSNSHSPQTQSHLSFVSREQEAQGHVTQTHPARVRLLSSSCRVTGVGMAWQERQREGNLSEDTDSTGPRSRLYRDSPVPSELFPHL